MIHTVAILGPNGRVGSQALFYLLEAHKEGKLNLVVLHRPGGPPKNIPQDIKVDVREIDIQGNADTIFQAIQGINVLFSALSAYAAVHEVNVLEAVAKTPGFVTFVPCGLAIPFTPEDYRLASFLKPHRDLEQRAKELGVGYTKVLTGLFAEDFLAGLLGTDPKENKVTAGTGQLKNGLPISTFQHIGEAIRHLLSRDPASIANKTFSALTLQPSGQDMVDIFTKVNGKPPQLIDYAQADEEKLLKEASSRSMIVKIYLDHWEKGDLVFENPILFSQSETLEHIVRQYLQKSA